MLDLSAIPVVDNHCHPVLREQQFDTLRYRAYFTEASDPIFAEQHVANSVYYLWMLRQLALLLGCPDRNNEEEILQARHRLDADTLIEHLYRAARIDTLIFDEAHPEPALCYTPEQMGQLGHCRAARMLRLEVLMQNLIIASDDFDEVVAHYQQALSHLRLHGYVALKSIVAYRTGLNIRQWSKDEAVTAFHEARATIQNGKLRIQQKPLIDYLLHLAFLQAAEQHIPVQFHTGYGDNDIDMRLGNPLHLRDVMENSAYEGMSIVLLHESYPYTQSGAYLAAVYPQVYFDLSYTIPFVDRQEMLAFTRQALGVAPASKLMYSSDGIFLPEMHWAAAIRGRSVLGQVLGEMIEQDEIDEQQGYQLAFQILHDTAYTVYRL
ncbi:MAG TPA: amidohydrolase family protein [Ktedonobacteraceae bacterium]|nr:amidohydrolase family protein [Ktedonobacteraceae bacterium]